VSTTEGGIGMASARGTPQKRDPESARLPPSVGGTSLVELCGVSKRYPGVLALDRVDLEVRRGEIHALVGLNGAGKSTLVKVIAGALQPDSGDARVNGDQVAMRGPWDARKYGIVLVPQEVMCNPSLTAERNAMLGSERFWVRKDYLNREERERVGAALERLGVGLGGNARVDELSVPERRALQIAAGLVWEGSLLVLDEPTAVLSDADAETLISRLMDLRRQGQSIVYVSHRLEEVLEIADRVTVLRDGRRIATVDVGALDREKLIELMSGGDERARKAREDPG
jgi:ribose transport system ATP-binding protein